MDGVCTQCINTPFHDRILTFMISFNICSIVFGHFELHNNVLLHSRGTIMRFILFCSRQGGGTHHVSADAVHGTETGL